MNSTNDVLVEKILDNLYATGLTKETCEELFNYAMYSYKTDDSSRFISNIMLHGGLDVVRSFLLNEINKFNYQNERELYSFTFSSHQFEKAIENYNTVKGICKCP